MFEKDMRLALLLDYYGDLLSEHRREIMEICEIMNAQIVDMSKHFMMIQICDTPERTKLLLNMFQSISIVEVARTGTLALMKCMENDD